MQQAPIDKGLLIILLWAPPGASVFLPLGGVYAAAGALDLDQIDWSVARHGAGDGRLLSRTKARGVVDGSIANSVIGAVYLGSGECKVHAASSTLCLGSGTGGSPARLRAALLMRSRPKLHMSSLPAETHEERWCHSEMQSHQRHKARWKRVEWRSSNVSLTSGPGKPTGACRRPRALAEKVHRVAESYSQHTGGARCLCTLSVC
ncbi:hypothetical protein ACP70R_045338 [Stipagrostis hirtigluma subsp. patula]